jgi:hypothetical protein
MPERVVLTIHLPLEMGTVGRLLKAVARDYPDAVVVEPTGAGMEVVADPDLTFLQRREKAKARATMRASRG